MNNSLTTRCCRIQLDRCNLGNTAISKGSSTMRSLGTIARPLLGLAGALVLATGLAGAAEAYDRYPSRYDGWHYKRHHDWHGGHHRGLHGQYHWDRRYGWHWGRHYGPHRGRHHDWYYRRHHSHYDRW